MVEVVEKIISRHDLIEKISKNFIQIRKESKLRQEDMANILGISKNTIVNIENSDKLFNWPVVISIVLLFSSTSVVKEILGENNAIETIMKCAFLESNKQENSNRILYQHSLTNTISNTVKLASAIVPIAIGGGEIIKGLLDILSEKKK